VYVLHQHRVLGDGEVNYATRGELHAAVDHYAVAVDEYRTVPGTTQRLLQRCLIAHSYVVQFLFLNSPVPVGHLALVACASVFQQVQAAGTCMLIIER
jgi:hypothetical protein